MDKRIVFAYSACSRCIEIEHHSVQPCCNFQGKKIARSLQARPYPALRQCDQFLLCHRTSRGEACSSALLDSPHTSYVRWKSRVIWFHFTLGSIFFHQGFFSSESLNRYMLLTKRFFVSQVINHILTVTLFDNELYLVAL